MQSTLGSIEVSSITSTGHANLKKIMRKSMKSDIPVINDISCVVDPCTLVHYAFKLHEIKNYRKKTKKAGFETVLNAVLHNANDFDLPKYFLKDPSGIRTDTCKLTNCPTFKQFD